ncbi:hypothetical protein [Sutcliffiella rhizosphaerae]|uniref:DUF4845 domain-containing protein n=1 Tax=Sutcliffiella rhizosphaerae TaxID=2880967 RepID=A0ABN8A6I6_9BACI|nr:hypothetical protein [Sutcliffiella rhizosphaerae]CAG9620654.1 hypothetical protein BACCIP111883_01423 [Sutcliffiella rhizosphaerae]
MQIILLIILFGLCLYGFNWLMGYRKDHITIDFDERYTDFREYIKAIEDELVEQGRKVSYKGNRNFIIDDRSYIFIERNVSMGGFPVQRTILKPEK